MTLNFITLFSTMANIRVIDTDGTEQNIAIVRDLSLMELLRDAGYDSIAAICGGSCSCATCHVYVDPKSADQLTAIEEDEQMLVEDADGYDVQRSRLSCQIPLNETHDGLIVTLVESPW